MYQKIRNPTSDNSFIRLIAAYTHAMDAPMAPATEVVLVQAATGGPKQPGHASADDNTCYTRCVLRGCMPVLHRFHWHTLGIWFVAAIVCAIWGLAFLNKTNPNFALPSGSPCTCAPGGPCRVWLS